LIPKAAALPGDRGYDADWFRSALVEMGISPCIPSLSDRKVPIPHNTDLHRKRHKVENVFARPKDWRRIATCYDRCPILFPSAVTVAPTVIHWL
jgi:transposase